MRVAARNRVRCRIGSRIGSRESTTERPTGNIATHVGNGRATIGETPHRLQQFAEARGGNRVRTLRTGLVEGRSEAVFIDRFQHVVDGVHVEGALCVLVVRGDEQDHRHVTALQLTEHAEPIKPRHLHVETDQIRPEFTNQRYRLVSTLGFADHFDIRLTLHESANALPGQTFIVND